MSRCATALVLAWMLFASAQQASAQWAHDCWECFCRDYHRNAMWPEPFLMPDRQAVNAPFAMMVANGWRRQNLLSDYHFDEESNQLNVAGEMKVRFILTQMPPSRRTIFVQRGYTPDVTSARIAFVEGAAARVSPSGPIGGIVESDLPNDGWPADEIDAVARKFNATRPDPRLKAVSGADQSAAGAGNSN